MRENDMKMIIFLALVALIMAVPAETHGQEQPNQEAEFCRILFAQLEAEERRRIALSKIPLSEAQRSSRYALDAVIQLTELYFKYCV